MVAVGAVLTCPMALLSVSIGALLVIAFFSAAVAASLALSAVPVDMSINERVTRATRYALIGAVVAITVIGLISILGGFGLLVALLFAASSPAAVGWLSAWRMRTRPDPQEARIPTEECVPQGPSSTPVAEMSTPELVLAWRASFNSLLRAQTTASMGHIVARRQQYLDELERRDPMGLRRWLESGARAASDPTKYLHGDDGGASPSEAA